MYDSQVSTGLLASFGIAYLLFLLVVYVFFAYCIKMIAEKTGESSNLWWLPIANLFILGRVAGKSGAFGLLAAIPLVNIVLWMEVAKRRGKDQVWGIIAGLVGIVGIPYLAFTD